MGREKRQTDEINRREGKSERKNGGREGSASSFPVTQRLVRLVSLASRFSSFPFFLLSSRLRPSLPQLVPGCLERRAGVSEHRGGTGTEGKRRFVCMFFFFTSSFSFVTSFVITVYLSACSCNYLPLHTCLICICMYVCLYVTVDLGMSLCGCFLRGSFLRLRSRRKS